VLFFVAVLPQFVVEDAGSVPAQSLVLGGSAVLMALLVDGGYAVLAARAVGRGIPASAARWGRRASGLAFCGLAAVALLG
jgi:threonine/homoserine/homoserine lactone efflux protein